MRQANHCGIQWSLRVFLGCFRRKSTNWEKVGREPCVLLKGKRRELKILGAKSKKKNHSDKQIEILCYKLTFKYDIIFVSQFKFLNICADQSIKRMADKCKSDMKRRKSLRYLFNNWHLKKGIKKIYNEYSDYLNINYYL